MTTDTLPLVEAGPRDVVARRGARDITRAEFLRDVAHLARALPAHGHLLNVCVDRYRFAVGLAAAIVRDQVSVLPATTHAATIAQLESDFPDLYCLAETPQADIDLPQVIFADAPDDGATTDEDVPMIPVDRVVAYVFTSGSTGAPKRHRKTWGSLVVSARAEADALFTPDGLASPVSIVATVPPQHMYGLESSVLIAWHGPATLVAERPFFPADIAAVLARSPEPRMLVTTPFHLRTLMADGVALPRIALVLSATAPLSATLAAEVEQRTDAPIAEIYGCTETGQLATRRSTADPCWTLFDGIALDIDGDVATASGGHIDAPTPLNDVIELADDHATTRRFSLAGRSGDLVNIAGKRTSLAHLNLQLNAIEGVIDGAFYKPDDDAAERDGVTRLGAVVVAPTLTPQRLLELLRARIDAAFLPRPLHFVDRLPRNNTGKLTDAVLRSVVATLAARGTAARDANPQAPR